VVTIRRKHPDLPLAFLVCPKFSGKHTLVPEDLRDMFNYKSAFALTVLQLLRLGALPRLIEMVKSSDKEEAVKAFYAVSAIVRNSRSGQEAFYTDGGAVLLQVPYLAFVEHFYCVNLRRCYDLKV
jgi:hypothetical protein